MWGQAFICMSVALRQRTSHCVVVKNPVFTCSKYLICHLVDDLMAGKRVYMTASTAREHTQTLWEREGKVCDVEKKKKKISLLCVCRKGEKTY